MPIDGFTHISQFKPPRRLMIGIEGVSDSGKTEFSMTGPPGVGVLAIDRGYEHIIAKGTPPLNRQKDVYLRTFKIPKPGQDPGKAEGNTYLTIWNDFYSWYIKTISCPDFKTVVIDGDSDLWELQNLAAFGKVTQIPPIMRTEVNAARRVLIARGFDSGKNIIFTYRVAAEYEDIVKLDSNGKPTQVSVRTGDMRRVGFNDQSYLVQVQLRAQTRRRQDKDGNDLPLEFGVRILKCKPDPELVGAELWGRDCNFKGLVETIYPESDPAEWGL